MSFRELDADSSLPCLRISGDTRLSMAIETFILRTPWKRSAVNYGEPIESVAPGEH